LAIRSVFEIDVHDEKFKNFAKMFEKYQSMLNKSGGDWDKTNKSLDAVTKNLSAAILAQTEMLEKLLKGEKELQTRSDQTALSWRDLARSSKTVASQIKDATTSLLKWASIGGVISGLLGAGGLFGIDAMAGGVGSTRRSSLGLGTTYGEKKAFDVNYGRLVDSESNLSSVNAALHDVTKRSSLYSAGLSEADLQGKDTAQVAVALLGKVKNLVDRTDPRLLGQLIGPGARLEGLGYDLQALERIRATSGSEIAGYGKTYGSDVGTLGLNPAAQRAWQDFSVQMSRAGSQIENVFVVGLGGLTTPLKHLSESVVKSIETFSKSKFLGETIEAFGHGIESAAKYISSKQFQDDIVTFATDVGLLAKAVADGLKWLGIIPGTASGTKIPGTNLVKGDNAGDSFLRSLQSVKHDIATNGVNAVKGPDTFESPAEATYKAMLLANFPGLRITGEGRSAAYNAKLEGSAKNSMHISGEALDLTGISKAQLQSFLKANKIPYTELLDEGRHGKQGPHLHWGWGQKSGATVKVQIQNNTGGNAVVTASQLPGQNFQ
jgi:hypothetical protein